MLICDICARKESPEVRVHMIRAGLFREYIGQVSLHDQSRRGQGPPNRTL
jgi:hypothetical protein